MGGSELRDVVEENDGVFVLPLAEFECCGFKYLSEYAQLLLRTPDYSEEAYIGVANPKLHAEVVGLAAKRARVVRVTVSKESTLRAEFEGGTLLEAPAGRYEEWEVVGPGRVHVVSPAGGGEPAIWDATSTRFTLRPGEPVPDELAEMMERFGMPQPSLEAEIEVTETKEDRE